LALGASLLAAATALLAAVAPAAQVPDGWDVDPAASSVTFEVRHLVVSRVEGHFGDFEVTVTGSAPAFADASVRAVVEIGSVRTGDDERDEDILKPAFLDADRFPRAYFVSRRIEPRGSDRWKMTGDLTLKGTSRSIELDVRRDGPVAGGRMRMIATGTIDRFEFGIRHNPIVETGGAVIARDVELAFAITLIRRIATQ
jgi:polyisoprenoid-binding protein YceI